MKKYLSTFALILLLSLTFVGCSDDGDNNNDGGNTPVETKNYYPLNDGHYRVYNNLDVESSTITGLDSVVVTDASDETKVVMSTFTSFDGNDWTASPNTDTYQNDSNQTLIGGDAFNRQLQDIFKGSASNIFGAQEMYTIIDQAESNWNIFSDNQLSLDVEIPIPNFFSATFTINEVNISAVNSGTENVDLGDEVFNGEALKIVTTTTIKGVVSGLEMTLTSKVEKWYGENIGTIKTNILKAEVSSLDTNTNKLVSTILPLPTRSEIIRYSVIDSQ